MKARRLVHLVIILCIGFAVIGCDRQKIGDINADPGRFHNKEVTVGGRVTQSFGMLGKGIYQIEDGTGSLWVLAETRGVPSKGALAGVKGRITPTVTFMGQNYATVMRESDRRAQSEGN
jgi:hypothetical protein